MWCCRVYWSLPQKTLHLFCRRLSIGNGVKDREIYIPTSYGQLAGKVWGPEDGRKVLALHGWQDNCATFNTLIPLLPKHLRIVAVDFSGHGLSSHKPLGSMYHFIDLLIDIKTAVTHLKWKHFSFLAHSMGGSACLLYACCFPEEVKALATLEGLDSDVLAPFEYPTRTAYLVNNTLKIHSKLNKPTPTYSYEEAKSKLLEGLKNYVTGEGISHLIKRSLRPAGRDQDKYVFTRDIRIQALDLRPFTGRVWIEYLGNLQCELLRVKATDGMKYHKYEVQDFLKKHYKDREEQYQLINVEGLHHVHLEHPERVAPYLSQFFAE